MKKIFAFVAALLLCIAFPLAVLADTSTAKLIDSAGILSPADSEEVLSALEKVGNHYAVDIAVLTTNGLNGKSIRDFSDDYYDEHGYGTGSDHSGVLWVIDMESRESYVTTSGEGISAVTDYGKQLLADTVNPYMRSGDYKGAMLAYAETMDEYFAKERAGNPVDTYEEAKREHKTSAGAYAGAGVISAGIGFGISFGITGSMKKKLISVRKQASANAYADENGLNLKENTDRYLYHRVVAVPLPKNDGPRGGGSTVHTSSSGSTHGGGSLGGF